MASMDDQEIREGFLCPLCMQDLHSINQLQHHFFNSHSNEDHDTLQTLMNFLGKAKKKILNFDSPSPPNEESNSAAVTQNSYSSYKATYRNANWQNQEIGVTSSHTDYFKRIRESRMDRYVVETNKLVIRLDKLVTNAPSEPAKRKAHEQAIVHWISDNDVRLCPSCAKSFSIARRRHHCRLCGGIMCDSCSEFISFATAKKLTQPVGYQELGISLDSPGGQIGISRSSSNSSLNSMISSSGEPHIRTCRDCKKLMERRKVILDQNTMKPALIQLYERLKRCMEEADTLCPTYIKMAYSLNGGESKYSLQDAQTLRVKLLKLTENVDLLSKKITILDDQTNFKLQRVIRQSASIFLQEKLLGIPNLPTEEEVQELQERYRQNQGRKFSTPALEAVEDRWSRFDTSESGWGPENEAVTTETDEDPMLQQMKIIRNYIQQAREAHRYDEVSMLESNLRELQQEYWKGRMDRK